MNYRLARKIISIVVLLTGMAPLAALANPPAPDAQSPEIVPTTSPACANWGPDHIDCFVIGSDKRIWNIAWHYPEQWGTWRLVTDLAAWGAQINPSAGIALAIRTTLADIFVVGFKDGVSELYRITWDGSRSIASHSVGRPGNNSIFEIACASRSNLNLECFARASDNHLWQRTWNGETWGAWSDLGALPGWAPYNGLAAVVHGDKLTLITAGSDGHAYRRTLTGPLWTAWADDGLPLGIALLQVACDSRNADLIECAFSDVQGGVWHRQWTSAGGWGAWLDLKFPPSFARSIAVSDYSADALVVLVNADDGRFYRRFRDPGLTEWSPWLDLARPKDIRIFIPKLFR